MKLKNVFQNKNRKNKTITRRVMILIVTAIIPINLISLFFLLSNYRGNRRVVQSEIDSSLAVMAENVHQEFVIMQKSLLVEMANSQSLAELQDQYENLSLDDRYEDVQEITEFLKTTRSIQKDLDVTFYYLPDSNFLIKQGSISSKAMDYVSATVSEHSVEEKMWVSNYVFDANGVPVFLFMGKYRGLKYGFVMQLNLASNKMKERNSLESGRTLFFGNEKGSVISKSGRKFLDEANTSMNWLKHSAGYYLASAQVGDTGLYIYEVVPYSQIDGAIGIPLKLLMIFFAVYIIAAIPIVILSIGKWILKPLEGLNEGIAIVESGNTDYRMDEQVSGAEFRRVHHNFNHMLDEIQDMQIDIYEKELEKNQIRMDYLSHQIQPHFVLNALNILYSYEPEEYELSRKMILCISKYFRHIVYANDKFVTLKSEMDHIENYFEIQRARYPELFYSWVEYDEGLKDALVPPLLIQNFAENAIKHSLKIGNRITIFVIGERIKEESGKEKIRIRLADTGEGVSDQILEEIEEFKRSGKHQEHLGVGMQNSIERLKVLYEDRAKLTIARDPNYRGTNVELVLPIFFAGQDLAEENWD